MQEVSPKELAKQAERLLRDQFTMTLATSSGDEPWAAPVYYVYHRKRQYFFSSPRSRHIVEALAKGRAAAAVFVESNSWQEIRGLQMSGTVNLVPPGMEALRALVAYIRKFPLVKEFFSPGEVIAMEGFEQRFNVRFYRFTPQVVYYVDNSVKFGFRQEVRL
jgi:uncharacterized protein YhbP (UPF0306 family)